MYKIDLFKRLRLSFVATCVVVVSMLLAVLFSVLWTINFRNSINEVNTAMERMLVLNQYNISLPPVLPDDDPESYNEVNSLYSKTILFSATKDKVVDYPKLYKSYPYLADEQELEAIVNRTIAHADKGAKTFEYNFIQSLYVKL